MFRRILLVVAVVVLGATALPLSATAYDAPPYATTVSDSTPAAGAPFTVTATGIVCGTHNKLLTACPNATLTVTSSSASVGDGAIAIAGTKALSKAAVFGTGGSAEFDGTVTWSVTLAEPGTYTLRVVRDWTGELMSELTVVVGAGGGAQGSASAGLGATGFEVPGVIALAAVLVLAGVAAMWLARRRLRGGPGA